MSKKCVLSIFLFIFTIFKANGLADLVRGEAYYFSGGASRPPGYGPVTNSNKLLKEH